MTVLPSVLVYGVYNIVYDYTGNTQMLSHSVYIIFFFLLLAFQTVLVLDSQLATHTEIKCTTHLSKFPHTHTHKLRVSGK